jgi:hypothetical protein
MVLLSIEDFRRVQGSNKIQAKPIFRGIRLSHMLCYLTNVLCDMEKSKILEFFTEKTKISKKKIKRITITDPQITNNIEGRLYFPTELKGFTHRNNYWTYDGILPDVEIIEWPADEFLTGNTFNTITKNKYISQDDKVMIGTFIIPIINSSTKTEIVWVGQNDFWADSCICERGCICTNGKSNLECPCKDKCICRETCRKKISENKALFHLTELETREVYSEEARVHMYVHIQFRNQLR